MSNKITTLFAFVFGVVLTAFAFLSLKKCQKQDDATVINQDYYLITNQIEKMNKMVVLEQNFSSFQTHKSSMAQIAGFDILPREMVLYTTAKAQVSYDLKKMKIEVDSTHKQLIIQEIPKPEIKMYPDVKIHFMDDYAINRFDQKDLNGIMESAKKNMVKSINQQQLIKESQSQLSQNLKDIFVLAKALNYSILDKTNSLDKDNL